MDRPWGRKELDMTERLTHNVQKGYNYRYSRNDKIKL